MTCLHENTVSSKRTTFCLDCDQIVVPETPREQRYPRPADNPPQGWISRESAAYHVPLFAAFYAAWPAPLGGWHVVKVHPGQAMPPPATHWHHDSLGVPTCGP